MLNGKMSAMSDVGVDYQGRYSPLSVGRLPLTIVTTVRLYPRQSDKSVRHVARRRHRRPDDSRGILQRGGYHRGPVLQQWHPFVGLAADSAAGDEQLGAHRVLDGDQHLRHLLGPLFEAPATPVADRGRGAVFSLLAAHLEVPEFGVGQQNSVVDDR